MSDKKMSKTEYEYFKALIKNKKIDFNTYSKFKDFNLEKAVQDKELMDNIKEFTIQYTKNDMDDKATVKVPVLGNIPAGIPSEAIEYIEDWEEIPASWVTSDKEYFALKIKGNSMFPKYLDGDIVIFQRACVCDNGKCGAVMIDNSDVTFKKIIKTEAGMILQPINEKEFEPIFYSNKQIIELKIKIIGVPKEIRRQVD